MIDQLELMVMIDIISQRLHALVSAACIIIMYCREFRKTMMKVYRQNVQQQIITIKLMHVHILVLYTIIIAS